MIYSVMVSLCRPWPCLHSIPTSCDLAAMASGLVRVLLHHDHPVRNRRAGQLQPYACLKENVLQCCLFFFLNCLYTNLSFCHSIVYWARKYHDLFNGYLPFLDPKRIPQRASSDACVYCQLCVWPVIGVRGEL